MDEYSLQAYVDKQYDEMNRQYDEINGEANGLPEGKQEIDEKTEKDADEREMEGEDISEEELLDGLDGMLE